MTTNPTGQASLYRTYVLFVLVLVNTVNFIDRQVVGILAPSIQEDLSLSNTQLGVLMGLVFTMFYSTLGFPIGRLADKHKRTSVLAGVLALWSGMTALCGAAANYALLLLCRVGVGVGEAGAGPASHSLLSDLFAKKERATALGVFSFGVPLGTLLAYLGGGLLVENLGWRMTFVVVGAPGVVLALIVLFTIREPERGATDVGTALKRDEVKFWEGIRALWSIPTFRIMGYAGALSAFCGYGVNLWVPGFLTRIHQLGEGAMALPLALSAGVGGGLGAFLGGWLTTQAAKRDARAYLILPSLSMALFAVALAILLWTPSVTIAFSGLFVQAFMQFFLMGPFFGLVQSVAPLRARALATAFFFFILSGVGFGLGPVYVGFLNDVFSPSFGEAEGLRLALTTLVVIQIAAAVVAFSGRNRVPADIGETLGGTAAAEPADAPAPSPTAP